MRPGNTAVGPASLPAQEPRPATGVLVAPRGGQLVTPASSLDGASPGGAAPITDPVAALWNTRWRGWKDGFTSAIAKNAQLYWRLYRNFDDWAPPGPNGQWRDRTIPPTAFHIIETRIPRLVLAQFGGREWMTVEAREAAHEQYEEIVRALMETSFDEVGKFSRAGNFLTRVIDGFRYCQIMGHVWWTLGWRQEWKHIKTKVPNLDAEGRATGKWQPIERTVQTFDGLDLQWLPLDSLAIPLRGERTWAIQRIDTTYEQLKEANDLYYEQTGQYLYPGLSGFTGLALSGAIPLESFDEPRTTEGWPFDDNGRHLGLEPSEHRVELWLCWDNRRRTLTKIANRRFVLDHGLSPTPDGLDPYWDLKAVPIPDRVYGDSILNWTWQLNQHQTRIKRARGDEILLGMWSTFVYRAGTIKSSQNFLRPGGAMAMETIDPTRPLSDSFLQVQRPPVLPQAWQEEEYAQRQAQNVAAADSVTQGVEATTKSRNVSATEIQQRSAQGNVRYQMENLYVTAAFKQPLLERAFELLQMNLTQPKIVKIVGESGEAEPLQIDLTQIQIPVDFKLGGGIWEFSREERVRDLEMLVALAGQPALAPYLKPDQLLTQLLKNLGSIKNVTQLVKTQEQLQQEQMQAAMQQQAMAGMGAAGAAPEAQGETPPAFEDILAQSQASPATAPSVSGLSTASLLAGVPGQALPRPPSGTGTLSETI